METYEVVETSKTFTIKYVRFYLTSLILNTTANFIVTMYDINHEEIKSQVMTFTPEEYQQWGLDDNIAIDIIMNRLGLTPIGPSSGIIPINSNLSENN